MNVTTRHMLAIKCVLAQSGAELSAFAIKYTCLGRNGAAIFAKLPRAAVDRRFAAACRRSGKGGNQYVDMGAMPSMSESMGFLNSEGLATARLGFGKVSHDSPAKTQAADGSSK